VIQRRTERRLCSPTAARGDNRPRLADEEGNANAQSSLKPGEFGHSAARRIAPGAGEKVELSTENREYESGAIFSDGVSCESSLPVGEEGEEARRPCEKIIQIQFLGFPASPLAREGRTHTIR